MHNKNIGIIGVGKLGLVYALAFEKDPNYKVWASSYKKEYVDNLQQKITDSVEPGVAEMLAQSRRVTFTTDNHDVIDHCDVIYVMVATPSLADGSYDVTAIDMVVQDFVNHTGSVVGKILVVGSTVNPGDCEKFQQRLQDSGVYVIYSPTFAAQGTVVYDVSNPIAVSFGSTDAAVVDQCIEAFRPIIPKNTPIHRLHPTTAEIMKLAANCYGTLRINYYNMIGRILLTSGLQQDLDNANQYLNEVDRRKASLRFGFGYGGPCYPRDNRSFRQFTDKLGMRNELAVINDDLNKAHCDFLADYLLQQNTDDLPFYFPYLSYKPGVKIFEESHQLKVCEKLLRSGAKVFVEPSKFLDESVIEDLQKTFEQQIFIKSSEEISRENLLIYAVTY